jgi:Fe-Mn family superoxide dismutase
MNPTAQSAVGRLACTRRRFLRAGAIAVASTALIHCGRGSAAPPPIESGLSFEGLLKHEPGFQPRQPMSLPYESLPGFLSKRQLGQNYAAYRDAFVQLSAAEHALASASRAAGAAAEYARLRSEQLHAANSVLLHEFYFRNLTAAPIAPPRYVVANINEHMGSLESWRDDFAACARVSAAWTALVYDPYDDRWHNLPMSEADAGGWVGANPLVVCDTAEHAWSIDYRDREAYVGKFFDHIDWKVVAGRYRAVDRQ